MVVRKSTEGQNIEHVEDLESAALLPNKECRKCSSVAETDHTRHVFRTIVFIALAYICFLETNTRLAVQNHETHVPIADRLPYCKQTTFT